jgi:cytochrome c-type biogenesis protein CcmF
LTKDLYTYIKYVALEDPKVDEEGFLEAVSGEVQINEPIRLTETVDMTIDSIVGVDEMPSSISKDITAKRAFVRLKENTKEESMIIAMISKNGTSQAFPADSKLFGMRIGLEEKEEKFTLTVQQHSSKKKDLLIISAQVFPAINLLWLGCIIMVIGTTMAIVNRINQR